MKHPVTQTFTRLLWSIFFFLLFFHAHAQIKMSNFMGANITREDPLQYLNCVGFAREYHSWVIDEGDRNKASITPLSGENNCFDGIDNDMLDGTDCSDLNDCDCASPLYPNNVCRWNPGYQGLSNERFHAFYQNVLGNLGESGTTRVPICLSLNHTLPSILFPFVPNSSNEGAAAEYKPIYPLGSPTAPASYEYYADYLTQFSRHFGGPPTVSFTSKQPLEQIASSAIVGYIEP